jgi:hypothetical protein
VRAVRREWTTAGRLSVRARGRFALTEPSGRLAAWLGEALRDGAERIAPAPAGPPSHLPRRPAASQECAA